MSRPSTPDPRALYQQLDRAFVLSALLATAANELFPGYIAVATKLVPMGILITRLALLRRSREVDPRMATWLLAGFVVSTVGDVVIGALFVAGIAAFLLAHLAYLASMGRPRGAPLSHALAAIPALCVGGGMAWILVGGRRIPEPLLIPVIVYMGVITAMLARAAGRALVDARTPAARLMLAGAATFVLSDALIAFSRWVFVLPHPKVAILVTYYIAQRLLLEGAEPTRPAAAADD